jgi:ABC-2 type transport system ATP-binding protein
MQAATQPLPATAAVARGRSDAQASSIAIDVRGLTKRYGGRAVVDHVSIRVPRGAIFGFLGPNGSGKTTTIRMLCGLLTPDEGDGTCLGFDLRREAAAIKREVGYMTQRFSLYEDLSIEENLAFVARMYDVPDRRAAIATTLDRLGLTTRRGQLAGTLSGGWKQRLALAACLLHDPKLLLLDEPTAGVDPGARREFWDHIHDLAHEGITVLVSTHYMDEAERCHELAYIAYGRLLAHGTAQEVIRRASLATWAVEGEDLIDAARELRALPGVEMVVPFGAALHVSGTDAARLRESLRAHAERQDLRLTEVAPGLEDVFIHLMRAARHPLDAAQPPAR